MNKIFGEWKIVPIYLLLIFLGQLTYYLHSIEIKNFAWIVYILIILWAFRGIGMKPLNPKLKKIEPFINNISIFLLPIVVSIIFINAYSSITLGNFFFSSLTSFFFALWFAFLIIANHDLITSGNNDFERSQGLFSFLLIIVFFGSIYYKDIISDKLSGVLSNLGSNMGIFITCTLTFVLLCATLSLLSFTYILAIDIDKKKKIMQKNGEYFFSSTILSIISLLLLVSLSIYANSLTLFDNFKIILNYNGYLEASLFVSLAIMSLITFFYSFIYIIRGIYSSTKALNVNWTAD